MASNESEDARSSMVASDSNEVNASNDSAESALMNKPKRPSTGAFKSQYRLIYRKALPHKIRQGS